MLETLINYVDKFGPEVLVILTGMMVILSTLFLWLWFSNRRKYHNLKHAIPANVVKNYLDSIIQNSTALKSSLFRGGGLELDGIPSVMPVDKLGGGTSVAQAGAPSTALLEELNQKKAQLASLEAQLSSLQSANKELEAKFQGSDGELKKAHARIKELEAMLAKGSQGGEAMVDNTALDAARAELESVSKERDEFRDRLKEFEIIADDLANLKRLQQENEQLKKSLAAQGGALPETTIEEEVPQSNPEVDDLMSDLGSALEESTTASASTDDSALEDFLSSPDEPQAPAEPEENLEASASAEGEGDETKERTPEDLLSEFEKMLG